MDREDQTKQLTIDFMNTFTSESGRRVLGSLSKLCRENNPCFVDHNTHYTAYNEGKRCVILHIRSQLNKDLHKEVQKKARSEE